jgi:glycosyltransferase involved in cell wall biosynthesis
VAKEVAKQLNLKVVQQHHSYRVPENNIYKDADALLLASPDVAKILSNNKNKRDGCSNKVGCIKFLPPLCDENKFLNFTSNISREQFFLDNFGIKLNSAPIICMIANFYKCKNHEGLLEALNILIHKYKIPVQCVLAGKSSESRIEELRKLCKDFRLDEYVKFLGFVEDTPSLLFYSDIFILPSKGDAFAITILEAAFMHKPIILSQKAGAADLIIKDNQTGLLCDPYNSEDIALKIKKLISDSDLRTKLGSAAFDHVTKNFSTDFVLDLYVDFYKQIVSCKK